MSYAKTASLAALLIAATGLPAHGGKPLETEPAQRAELILHSGVFWTVNDKQPQVQAVAIGGGRFMAVGNNVEVLALRGPDTKMVDLQGAFAVPGFNDTHVHFASAARFLEFNIMATAEQDEFVARVERLVEQLPKDEWIVGGFWGAYDQWAAGSAGDEQRKPFVPDMRRIERLTQQHPVLIQKFDRSEYAANHAALRAAGVDPSDPKAEGVEFVRDDQGPTGILRGRGVERLFRSVRPQRFTYERRLSQSRNALREIAGHGVTNISDMSDDMQLRIYRDLHRRGELTARVHFRYGLERWGELAQQGIRVGSGDPWIRLGSLKGHIDGIMGTSSARFFEPYSNDPSNRGNWRRLMVDRQGQLAEGKFLQYMLDADRAGLQITVHAIGDEANHLLLDYLDVLNRRNGPRDRRFRLVHAQVIADRDFQRLGPLGVIAEVQPFHLSDDMRWMELRIGKERCRGAYAFRRIQQSGAKLAFGTDWPGTSASEYPINPLLAIYAATTRQTITGQPKEGWFPDQVISVEDAIRASTYNCAYANFEEDSKGSIEVGKLADMTVLSQNLLKIAPEEMLQTKVLYTLVDGKIVYQAVD